MTDNTKLHRALEICDEALKREGVERENFLQDKCENDPTLRGSVDSILTSINKSKDFIESPIQESTPDEGDYIGSYRLLKKIGEGGMGTVFLAERKEQDFTQKVAIKMVRAHILAKELIDRFNSERKILASLNHPYIAQLIDAGTSEKGIPYFVMEYVDGIPINDYCDQKNMTITHRLKLVQKVAMAVQSAHQNLIVHRDLKPANILITKDGIPKLLDFGIAKLIDQPEKPNNSGNTTIYGNQALTPDYASPEQIVEGKVTTVSDVYTLGVLTYQLLTGNCPYHIDSTSRKALLDSVERLTVPHASWQITANKSKKDLNDISNKRSTTSNRLAKTLAGDIDTILLKALHKDPLRRYSSVAAFSEDLERFITGAPITAREDSLSYRLSKYISRHWIGIGASCIIIISLLAGIVSTSYQARLVEKQRDIAIREAKTAESTVKFIKSVLFSADPWQDENKDISITDVLNKAEQEISTQFDDNPFVKAYIYAVLAEIHVTRGDYEKSIVLAKQAIDKLEKIPVQQNDESLASKIANIYRIYGLATYSQGEYVKASDICEKTISLYRQLSNPDWSGLARALDQMGMIQAEIDEKIAESYYLQALQVGQEHILEDTNLQITMRNNLATLYLQQGRYLESNKIFTKAIQLAEQSGKPDATTAILYSNNAGALKNLGKLDQALESFRAAVELQRETIGLAHPEAIITATSLGNAYQQNGELDKAEAILQKALAAGLTVLGKEHPIISYVQNVLGSTLCNMGKGEEGFTLAKQSLVTRKKIMPEGHWAIASGEGVLGSCYTAKFQYVEAEKLLLRAFEQLKKQRGEDNEVTLIVKSRLLELYRSWNKPELAIQYK